MLLWFCATSALVVWMVFRDPRVDFRLVMAGALLPDVVDAPFGGARVLHSLVASVGALALVMAFTVGRRPQRRRWLAVPIGMFLHLVVDGAFADARAFWWPFSGLALPDGALPSLKRGWWNVPLELAGLLVLVAAYRRLGLADPDRRGEFLRSGRIDATLAGRPAHGGPRC